MTLTDAEKTRLLAEGVMGWKAKPKRSKYASWFDGNVAKYPVSCCDYWDPLHNESHAAEVRERMVELGYCVTTRAEKSQTWCSIFKHPIDTTRFGDQRSMCRNVCECALLALGLAKEEEL